MKVPNQSKYPFAGTDPFLKPKPLTGWLILLIVILGPLTFGQVSGAFARLDTEYQPFMASHPSLPRALNVYRFFQGACVCVSIYTAWVLYRRRPGTLKIAQAGLVIRAVLTIAGSVSLPMLAGFSAEATQAGYQDVATTSAVILLITGVWYLYLVRSDKVREIYAG
jgi:hypothetical protein